MKKLFLIGFGIISMSAFSQSIDFGLKAGLVYNTDKGVVKTLSDTYNEKGKGSMGFQGGAMMRIKAAGFYVQPELLYTSFKYEFDDSDGELQKTRLDIPINVGKTFALGLVQLQTGPVVSINMKDKLKGYDSLKSKDKDDLSLGWQIGTGLNIKKLNLDLRYEFGLGKTTSKFLQEASEKEFQTENRVNMLNFSVGYFF